MGHGHRVDDLGASKTGIDRDTEAQLRSLVQGQHAALGGIGTGADAETHLIADELGGVVAGSIGARLPGRRIDAQAIVAVDAQGTRHVGGSGRNGIGRLDADGAVLPCVLELDGVFQLLAGAHVGGTGTGNVADRLLQGWQQVGAVQVADEYQRVREVRVLVGGEGQGGAGGAVGHPWLARIGGSVGDVDQLEVDREVVDVGRVACGDLRTQPADAAVPEIANGTDGIAQRTTVEYVCGATGEAETVARIAFVAFPHQGAHVGIEVAAGGRQQATDRCRRTATALHVAGIAIEHHQAAERLGGVLVNDDQRPAAEIAQGIASTLLRRQAADRVGARTRLPHLRSDIDVRGIGPPVGVVEAADTAGELIPLARSRSRLQLRIAGITRPLEVDVPAVGGNFTASIRGSPAPGPVQTRGQHLRTRRHDQVGG